MAPTAQSAHDLPASGAEPPLSNNASSPQLADDTTLLVGDSPPLKQNDSMGDATKREPRFIPFEVAQQIVEPVVFLRVACHGHRRADNRGVLLEEYRDVAGEIVHQFGLDKQLASVAVGTFKNAHTMRLEAKKLRDMQLTSSPINMLLMGSNAIPLPFDPAQLQRLTIFFHGGSLSSCDRETFKLVRESIPKLTEYFPNRQILKLEITWDIDEDQKRFDGQYIHLLEIGEVRVDDLPLVDIPGAQKTCREFFYLTWQLYEFCAKHSCEIEVFSMDRSAVFKGKWENDLEAATHLFPNSNAWHPRGFQIWMSEYTTTHYQMDDVNREGEPIAVEYVGRAADLDPADSDGYGAFPLANCLVWVRRYRSITASQKKAVARENEEREASY